METINLFDDLFRNCASSVAGKTSRHVKYVRDQLEWDGITLFTDGYIRRPIVKEVQSRVKLGWLREPQCLHPEDYEGHPVELFDAILTHYAPLLEQPEYRFVPYAGIWIEQEYWGIPSKPKQVSMLVGAKRGTEGHRVRHEVADALEGQVDFYGARGQPTDYSAHTKRRVNMPYAFTVVTECCQHDNLFTEHLLDCFAVGTVPIFWGCPNIGSFFDERGILAFETTEEAVDIVRNLPEWTSLLPHIKTNLALVAQYEVTEDWMAKNTLGEWA